MTADPPEYDREADLDAQEAHAFERQTGAPNECRWCSLSPDFHPTLLTDVPELQTDGPLLPEDSVDFWLVPCPVCKVTSGSCVSLSGYYRPAHSQRLDKARGAA